MLSSLLLSVAMSTSPAPAIDNDFGIITAAEKPRKIRIAEKPRKIRIAEKPRKIRIAEKPRKIRI